MIEGQEGVSWPQWLDLAQACERHGIGTLFRSDHYMNLDGQHPERGSLDAWGTLCALAAATTTLRLGTMVSPATFRHPSELAKLVVTVDHVSGGRVELGLGAGWHEREHAAYGFSFAPTRTRLDVLEETLQVVKRLWTEETVSFAGKHLELDGAYCDPKPIQQLPPIWVGGGGEKKTLRIAARHADATNWQTGLPQFVHKSQVLADHCEAEGRDFESITRTHGPDCRLFDSDADLRAWLDTPDGGALWGSGDPDEYVRDNFVGTVEQVAEKVQGYVDAGCAEFILWFRDFPSSESLERFMADVVPKVTQ